ncbi:MAG TPA: DNA polymerase ligase N-terminal domain-containing protein [Acidimicrobiales bacterium]|nr:DNA polymerase ligase N-terminal domain-containing protein [Acidimicrobiales bacterium]
MTKATKRTDAPTGTKRAKRTDRAKGAKGATKDRLAAYRSKRDFAATGEPRGVAPEAGQGEPRFVVQRHRASRLHYDLRLEMGGVLVSWAVPKGPTLDASVRRLAVHVEDHPLEYFDFEGVIDPGLYGSGDVTVWDWGHWRPHPEGADPLAAVEAGELHFDLDGTKLAGRFVLHRRGDGNQWILVHKHDDAAVDGWDPEAHPASVRSGRTNDEVAANPAESWLGPTDDELGALEALGDSGTWRVGGDAVRLTHLDKVLLPGGDSAAPITKRVFVRYLATIGPHLLPYLSGRPVNRHRFPDGVDNDGFWAKAVPARAPSWLTRWHDPDASSGRTTDYIVADRIATLAYLANEAAIELHPWTARIEDVTRPTWALIDIDPGTSSSFDDVLVLARLHRVALERLGLEARPKVTGKRGVQIWIPIAPRYRFDETRAWVKALSRTIGAVVPELVSWAWRVDERDGLARLDYTQNSSSHTLVAPFSARPAPGAPVSVPLEWDELDDPELRPDGWTIHTVADRLDQVGDPLRPLIGLAQELPRLAAVRERVTAGATAAAPR